MENMCLHQLGFEICQNVCECHLVGWLWLCFNLIPLCNHQALNLFSGLEKSGAGTALRQEAGVLNSWFSFAGWVHLQ